MQTNKKKKQFTKNAKRPITKRPLPAHGNEHEEFARDDVLKILLQEYENVCNEVRAINLAFLQLQTIPFAGVLFAFYWSSGAPIVGIILPMFVMLLFYNIIKYTIRLFKLGGYRMHLEVELHSFIGKGVLVYEGKVSGGHHDWIVGGVLQSFIAVPILIFSFYNAHVCFQKIPAEMTDTVLLYRFLLVQYILGFLALAVTSMCMLGAKDGIYSMVRRKDEGDVMWYYRKIGE
jgi:hypothetical protein